MAIIGRDAYVLLTKRSATMMDEPGRWCLPCGYLDWDETLTNAVEREVLEETGLDLLAYKHNISIHIPNSRVSSDPSSNRQNVSMTSIYVLEDLKELPEVTVTDETTEVEWCAAYPDDLKEKDLVFNHYDIIRESVNKIVEYKD